MKYTDFALEHTQVTGGGSTQTLSTSDVSFDLPRSGDLVNDCFACFHLPGLANVVQMKTKATVSLTAGDYVIDKADSTGIVATLGAAQDNVLHLARHDASAVGRWSGGHAYSAAADNKTINTGTKLNSKVAYPGATVHKNGETQAGVGTAGAADAVEHITWVQSKAGPDPFNLETSWDAEARCMRPCADVSTAAGLNGQAAEALGRAYERLSQQRDPSETVQYLSSDATEGFGANQAVDINAAWKGKYFECIESSAERKRYHLQADIEGDQALTVPGPQPYWCNAVGQHLIEHVRLKVGSQYVDTLYDHYLNMWDELSDKPGRTTQSSYGPMSMKGTVDQRKKWSQTARTVYVPIPMFFMRTSGNALPLIALQFHGVQISIKSNKLDHAVMNFSSKLASSGLESSTFSQNNGFSTLVNDWGNDLFESINTVVREKSNVDDTQEHLARASYKLCTVNSQEFATKLDLNKLQLTLNVGYVYLNVSERNKFADASFEILIDQVQENTKISMTSSKPPQQSLSLNHCVQELVWACTRTGIRREPFDYSGRNDVVNGDDRDNIQSVQLRLNNSTRFNQKSGQRVPGNYFRMVEPYLHHTKMPNSQVYAYSFALNPESEQPSGALNMSRVDQARLDIQLAENLQVGKTSVTLNDTFEREVRAQNLNKAETRSANVGSYYSNQLTNNSVDLHLYARNWNIFRITLGLGGVKWAS